MSETNPAYPSPLEGKLLTDLTEEVRGIIGFEVPEAEVKSIFEGHEQLLGEIREWGFCDTVISEGIQETLAKVLLSRPWPTFGDGEEAGDRFRADFDAAAKKRGWQPYTFTS